MARKKYSVAQRKSFHEKRVLDKTVSENKRVYSKSWFDGYSDTHASNNYPAVLSEISARKRRRVPHSVYDVTLQGYKMV